MNEAKRKNRTVWLVIIVLVVILGVLYLMLKHAPQAKQDLATPREPSPALQTPVQSSSTSTATMAPTAKPKATSTLIGLSVLPAATIGVTQIPPYVESSSGEDEIYLYRDVIVTLKFDLSAGMGAWAVEYLNLDDLSDNGLKNSDMMVTASEGTGVFYTLGPANNAMNYPAETSMDYASCLNHLSEFGGYGWADHGLPYCFLTDEGRMSVVQYVAGSIHYEDGFSIMSYRVTVYKQRVSD